jgi:hypothetical protein
MERPRYCSSFVARCVDFSSWPQTGGLGNSSEGQRQAVTTEDVLAARAQFPNESLAVLYGPTTIPPHPCW